MKYIFQLYKEYYNTFQHVFVCISPLTWLTILHIDIVAKKNRMTEYHFITCLSRIPTVLHYQYWSADFGYSFICLKSWIIFSQSGTKLQYHVMLRNADTVESFVCLCAYVLLLKKNCFFKLLYYFWMGNNMLWSYVYDCRIISACTFKHTICYKIYTYIHILAYP